MRIGKTQSVCEFAGVEPDPPARGSNVGIALSTLGRQPVNGLRHRPDGDASGWYLWCGTEFSEAAGFFSPLHIDHVGEYLPLVEEYLDLPPGYRFLVYGGDWEDVWFDTCLLEPT